MVSEDIQRNREDYLRIMREHGTKSPATIASSVSETQERLLGLFRSAPEERALRKPAPDEWCLRELALHAAFTERLIGKLIHYMARGGMPPPEDLAGAGIGMIPADDARSYTDVVDELERMNLALLDAVRDLPAEPDTTMLVPHPFFGPLNCLQWAGFQRVHDIDHIQHAGKILVATEPGLESR